MRTPLHVPLASGQGFLQQLTRATGRRGAGPWLAGLGLSFGLLGAPLSGRAQAPVIYGLGTATASINATSIQQGQQGLVLIDPATGVASAPNGATVQYPTGNQFVPYITVADPLVITGVLGSQTLVGLDSRPNTGELYALGYDPALPAGTSNAQLYTLNPTNGKATARGASLRLELGATDRIGFDFNPTVDRIRVVSALTQANYRLNPTTGAATKDLDLAYADGTPAVAGVGTVAYLNSYLGSTATTLYDIEELNTGDQANRGALSIQSPPNDGRLNIQGKVQVRATSGDPAFDLSSPKALDLDIYFNPSTRQNEAYLIEVTAPNANGGSSTNFYSLDLSTRIATQRRTAPDRFNPNGQNTVPANVPFQITDIAAGLAAPTQPALQGQLLYALAAGNLISFDSQSPSNIRSAVNFGAGLSAGQAVVGFDFRPLTGELFALGYDAQRSAGPDNAQLYTVSLSSGALTPVGGPLTLGLGGSGAAVGFDFNPSVDRIRVSSATNRANYRLNPVTGALVQADGALSGDIPALAYSNNDNDVSTGTTLYGYDQTTNFVVQSDNPNTGVFTNVGSGSGLTVSSAGVDFDIFTNNGVSPATNTAYLVAAPAGVVTDPATPANPDNLYTVDLTGGTATLLGRIGQGGNYTALAAFLTPTVYNGLLTWTGATSTEWNLAANWSPSFIPTEVNDVLIPGGPANQPTVRTTQPARALTLSAGAVLTTAAGGTLNVAGNFVNNGGAVAGSGTGLIALTGAAAQTIGGSSPTTFFNLSVGASGASLTAPAAVQRLLTLTGDLSTGGQALTLLSTATDQGQVLNRPGTVSGAVTVQRAIDGSLNAQHIGYRHYASPVAGAAVSDLNSATGSGFAAVLPPDYNTSATPRATQPFPNVFGYDQKLLAGSIATDHKFNFDKGFFVPTDAFAAGDLRAGLQPGHGYSVNIADDVTVDFVGALNNGDLTVGGLRNSGAPQAGYQFLGNPYPSALDWNLVTRTADIEPALYVFKSTGQYTGTYATYNNGASVNGGTSVLPVAQGFFVLAAAGATNASVTFTNAARLTTYDATPFQRGSADERAGLTLALRTTAGRGEQTAIYFEAGATPAYDAAYDAQHLAGPGAPLSLASAGDQSNWSSWSINGLPPLRGADVLVPLSLSAATPGVYSLDVDALHHLPAGYHAYLRDALRGTATVLTAQARLPLTLEAPTPATGRYAVLFSTRTQSGALAPAPAALAQLAGVYPNPAHGTATLLLPAALRGGQPTPVQVLNSLGQVVLRRTLPAGATAVLELPLTGLAPGIYAVRAQTAAGQVVKRLTVE